MVQPDESQLDEITLDQTENAERLEQETETSFPNDLETTNENEKLLLEETAEESHMDAMDQTLDTTIDENKDITQTYV